MDGADLENETMTFTVLIQLLRQTGFILKDFKT
jgi:hypothetical protein